jgi:hypothetical protein
LSQNAAQLFEKISLELPQWTEEKVNPETNTENNLQENATLPLVDDLSLDPSDKEKNDTTENKENSSSILDVSPSRKSDLITFEG